MLVPETNDEFLQGETNDEFLQGSEQLPSWTFDPRCSEASFRAWRMGKTWVNGRFAEVRGRLYVDLEDMSSSTCYGEIDPANLYAGEPCLNTRLRTEDFLGVEDGTRITFAARLAAHEDTDLTAETLVTVGGNSRLVTMNVKYLGRWTAPVWLGEENAGIATRIGMRAVGHLTSRAFGELDPAAPGEVGPASGGIEIALSVEAALDSDLEQIGALERSERAPLARLERAAAPNRRS